MLLRLLWLQQLSGCYTVGCLWCNWGTARRASPLSAYELKSARCACSVRMMCMQPHQNLHWLCYILHFVSHWPVLEYFFNLYWCQPGRVGRTPPYAICRYTACCPCRGENGDACTTPLRSKEHRCLSCSCFKLQESEQTPTQE
jgi:hypothetical protein